MRVKCIRSSVYLLALALTSGWLLADATVLLAQGRREKDGEPRGRDFRPPDRPSRGYEPPHRGGDFGPRSFEPPRETTLRSGFLFLDGEYLPPPYEVRYSDEGVTVNGRLLTCTPPPRSGYGRGFGGPPRSDQPWRELVGTLHSNLGSNNSIVMSFPGQPLFAPDASTAYELLKSLIEIEGRALKQVSVRKQLPEGFDKQVWDDWIEHFVVPEELRQPAYLLISDFDQRQEEALAQIRARRWLEALTYPLSVSAMVMSVLAIGHLLGGRPHSGQPSQGLDPSPPMIRALNWSLFFTAVFSSFDLVWTIVTLNTNDIRELNPIGSQFIHDPRHLAGFKIAITFSCLALLWLLRRHKRAQIAAWWVCLVLTLVTCRWLMVSSLLTSAV